MELTERERRVLHVHARKLISPEFLLQCGSIPSHKFSILTGKVASIMKSASPGAGVVSTGIIQLGQV
jgi:hypothetical protein